MNVGQWLIGHTQHFVIPAQAGIQAVPKQPAAGGAPHRAFVFGMPAAPLALKWGSAWIPAFAGMTK
ncbi:hypothetical protein [Azohydromonas aeria]|uniref:hypothetical protein n=1 Tax=Azohydromonas aeria TaxID=2590212 RepID=UPI0012F86E30|nr:hypothetical protein [Azohydromonas aeria]